jgi:DNA repair photolyase
MKILRRIEGPDSPQHFLGNDHFKLFQYYRDYGPNFQYVMVEHYDMCSFRCVYCITESQGKSRARFTSDPDVLEAQFLKEIAHMDENYVVCLCSASDPYTELEPELRLTRRLLEILKRKRMRFTVTTKGPWILDDLDIYKTIEPDHWFKMLFSFTSFNQEKANQVERFAPPVADRLDALCTMYKEGIPRVGAFIAPWIPDVTDLEEIFDRLPEGIPVCIQPLEIGDDFEEPLDKKSAQFSSKASLGKKWSFYDINYRYVEECNRLYDNYIKKFPEMEWRWPIYKDTHENDRGYFRQLKPHKIKPGYFGSEAFHAEFAAKNKT